MNNKICINKKVLYLCLITFIFVTLFVGFYSNLNKLLSDKKTINTEAAKNMIIYGTKAEPNEFPYFVRLYIDTPYINTKCGGTLINKDYVLTARHCIDFLYQDNTGKLTILIGVDNYVTTDRKVLGHYYDVIQYSGSIDNVFYPPDYGDIALIKLNESAKNIPYLSLPPAINTPDYKKLNITDGLGMTAIGAGYLSDTLTLFSDYLRKTTMILKIPKVKLTNTKQLKLVTDSDRGNTCGGDSGGPVILSRIKKKYVMGITSFGKPCDSTDHGFYTSVAEYSNWIAKVTNNVILPETGTVAKDANIKYFPPQKQLGLMCDNFKAMSDCNNNPVLCQWGNNLCTAK